MSRIKIIIAAVVVLVLLFFFGYEAYKWTAMRIYVPPDKALVVVSKYGDALAPDRLTIPAGKQKLKGIEEEVRGPGRYFLNPIWYDWQLVDLVTVPAGDPQRWDWDSDGKLKDARTAPMIGLVSLKEGKTPPPGQEVVKDHEKGIQRRILTPGVYKLNPHRYEVKLEPATIVPPGSVGVVTRLIGDIGDVDMTPFVAAATVPTTFPAGADRVPNRLVTGANQRGILQDVLQPGVYYLNPRMVKVTIVTVGYDAITLEHPKTSIRFYSKDGYQVEADFTVVWGRTPADAPNILATIGNWKEVEANVIEPAMKAACQNVGANYTALALIQGITRTEFQQRIEDSLSEQVSARHVHILLALIRNISIKDTSGKDATDGLLATIQRANIEIERELTNRQKTETEKVRANLEEALKLVDVARETVVADTNVRVANIMAEGTKQAAEIDAQRDLDIAAVQLQVAQLDAKRTEILGKASADVERLKNEAEAQGAKMLVDALGSPAAYNRYIFARNFQPQELRLIHAGPGTFWTDLKTFQEIGAAKMVQPDAAENSRPPR